MTARPMPRWPLFLIASPAAVAVWSGWVGLGGLCGFGPIHPLPGIADGFHLNTAITLPVGIEAYGSYALGAWLRLGNPTAPVAKRARTFARRSAIGSLALGMGGQVIYHLLAAAHAKTAPWLVTTFVACLPVASLGFGAALAHLMRAVADEAAEIATAEADRARERDEARMARRAARTAQIPFGDQAPAGPYGQATPYESGDVPVRGRPVRGARTGQRAGSDVDREDLVAELAAEMMVDPGWRPDYPALQQRTGCKRSYCEKVVRDARRAAARTQAEPDAREAGEPVRSPA
jgi:hypothetical protein